MQTQTNATGNTRIQDQGFDQMAVGLKTAIDDFQADQSSETWTRLVEAIKPVSDFGMKAWGSSSAFVRRHPAQTAAAVIGLAGVGFLVSRYLMSPSTPQIKGERNY